MHKPTRRKVRLPRWPSKGHRNHQSGRFFATWRAGRRPPVVPGVAPEHLGGSQVPALSRIVKMRREDALLHVELRACHPTRDERRRVFAPDVPGAEPPDASAEFVADTGARSWTVTLLLN